MDFYRYFLNFWTYIKTLINDEVVIHKKNLIKPILTCCEGGLILELEEATTILHISLYGSIVKGPARNWCLFSDKLVDGGRSLGQN